MDVQNRDAIDFIESIEFPDYRKLKTEIEQEEECGTDNLKNETIIRPKLEPREAFGQSEIKDEPTLDLEVKDIKKEIKEFDVMNKNVKIESKDGEQAILEFVKIIEFYDDVKPKVEVEEEPIKPKKEMDDEFQNGISVLEEMDNLDFNDETFINDSLPHQNLTSTLGNSQVDVKTQNTKKRFRCPICPTKFEKKSNLKVHVTTVHEGNKLHKCSTCSDTFPRKISLKDHISAVHDGIKPRKCPICFAEFAQKDQLRKHISAVHDGIKKPYKCSICDLSYVYKSNLSQNIASVHEGKKPHKCFNCDKCFSRIYHLIRHMEKVHEGKKPYKCTICEATLSERKGLRQHFESVHE